MGERGVITRLLAPKYGGYLTFAALEGRPSAPGQPTLADMRRLYRAPVQDSATKVFGIVGNPVSHSRSPVLHNRAMEVHPGSGLLSPEKRARCSRWSAMARVPAACGLTGVWMCARLQAIGFNGVYVPLLVDDMASFLKVSSATAHRPSPVAIVPHPNTHTHTYMGAH